MGSPPSGHWASLGRGVAGSGEGHGCWPEFSRDQLARQGEDPLWKDRHPRQVGTGSNEPPHKPPRSHSESRIGKIVGHGQREISHTPTHWQARRRWVEKAAPSFQGLQVSDVA